MEPVRLPEEPKANWRVEDCFGSLPADYARAFLHRNYAIGMHAHDFYEVNVVRAGSGWHYIEGGRRRAEAGCVFVIPPGVRHGYWQRESLEVHHLLLLRDFFARYAQELRLLPGFASLFEIEPFLRARAEQDLFLRLCAERLAAVEAMLAEMAALSCDEYAGAPILRDAQALRIVGTLSRWAASGAPRAAGGARSVDVLRAMEFLRAHAEDPPSLDALADMHHVSRATLGRAFRRVCGQSVGEYVADCRVERAAQMLAGSGSSVSEIAQACGYCDGSHLAREFSRRMGLSPRQYRLRGGGRKNWR